MNFLINFINGFAYIGGGATSASIVWMCRNKIKKEWESHLAQKQIEEAKKIIAAHQSANQ